MTRFEELRTLVGTGAIWGGGAYFLGDLFAGKYGVSLETIMGSSAVIAAGSCVSNNKTEDTKLRDVNGTIAGMAATIDTFGGWIIAAAETSINHGDLVISGQVGALWALGAVNAIHAHNRLSRK